MKLISALPEDAITPAWETPYKIDYIELWSANFKRFQKLKSFNQPKNNKIQNII